MAKLSVVAYPFAFHCGEIEVPDYIEECNYNAYIAEHWDEVIFRGVSLDYRNVDFNYKVLKE